MHVYDFNILEPKEFENFTADIVVARENKSTDSFTIVNTQFSGKDYGIDFKINGGGIIGQAKRYAKHQDLFRCLDKEVEKVKNLEPKRYILVLSLPISFEKRKKLAQLFSPYIKSETDIIDATDLNRLLEEHPKVLLRHNKLWISSTILLTKVLEDTVHKAFNDQSRKGSVAELKEISTINNYFVSTKFFPKSVEILRKKHFLIITGDPGIGKTTLARAVCHYFFEHSAYQDFHYFSGLNTVSHFPDINNESIIFIDDFLGNTIHRPYIPNISSFQGFVDRVIDNGALLIMTTREYIYQQEKKVNPRFNQLDDFKYVIKHTGYTLKDKLQILLNHIRKIELSYEAVRSLSYNVKEIINHKNYNPKLISEFLRKDGKEYENSNSFGWYLKEYLDNPYRFWEPIFLELSPQAQLVLICLFISNEPCSDSFLFKTFKSINRFRTVAREGFVNDIYNNAILELNDTFIFIDKDTIDDILVYSFANTFIKDFLLDYLRKNTYLIDYIIKGATAYNQLFFAFSNDPEDEIDDYESEEPLFGKKICLTAHQQQLLLDKVITDFDSLEEIKIERINWYGGDVSYQDKEQFDNRLWRLQRLLGWFNINYNQKAKNFILSKFREFAFWENDEIWLNSSELYQFPSFLKEILPYLYIEPSNIIEKYYRQIERTENFISFYDLRKLYEHEFDQFVKQNKKKITENIKDCIEEDIYHYLDLEVIWVEAGAKLDMLFDDIENVFELYQIRFSKKEWNYWRECAGKNGLNKRGNSDKEESEEIQTDDLDDENLDFDAAIQKLLPEDDDYLFEEDMNLLLSDLPDVQAEQLKCLFQEKTFLTDLTRYKNRFNAIIQYCLKHPNKIPSDAPTFINTYTDMLINDLSLDDQNILLKFSKYAKERNWVYFKQKQFAEFVRAYCCKLALFDEFIYRKVIIEATNGWYNFILPGVWDCLLAKCIISTVNKEQTYRNQFDDFEEPQNLWQYLKLLDEHKFYQLFIIPTIKQFYSEVFNKEKMTLLKNYYRFFGLSIGYSYVDGGLECGNSGHQNWITEELFIFLNIDLSIGLSEIFPCDCYIHEWSKDENRNNFIDYIHKNYLSDGSDEIDFSKLEDKQFWSLLIKTELAEIIYNNTLNLKLQFNF